MKKSFSYLGVKASSPPNLVIYDFQPTSDDWQDFPVGTLWLNYADQELFMLVSTDDQEAVWVELYPSSTEGTLNFITDSGTAVSSFGVLRVTGGDDIRTFGSSNVLTIKLDSNISLDNIDIPGLSAGVVTVDDAGLLSTSDGTAGQVLIAADDPDPVSWEHFDSSDGSIVFTFSDGGIDIKTAAGAGVYLNSLHSDTGTNAVPVGGIVNVIGDGNYTTKASGNTITIDLASSIDIPGDLTVNNFSTGVLFSDNSGVISSVNGNDGQVIISATGAAPTWGTLSSSDGSVIIDKAANSINLRVVGGSGSGSLDQLDGDTGSALPDVLGNLKVAGGDNINTTAASNIITINLDDSINQPVTSSDGTQGLYSIDFHDFMHNYGTRNTFLGRESGRRDQDIGSDNTAIGIDTLKSINSYGSENVAIGHLASDSADSDSRSVIMGALSKVTISNATVVGFNSIGRGSTIIGNNSYSATIGIGNNIGVIGVTSSGAVIIGNDCYSSVSEYVDDSIAIGNAIDSPSAGGSGNALAIGNFADNNQIVIGEDGSGDFQQNKCYIAGIYDNIATSRPVFIDSNSSLGYTTSFDSDGQILISNVPSWTSLSGYPVTTGNVIGVTYDLHNVIAINSSPNLYYSNDAKNWDVELFTTTIEGESVANNTFTSIKFNFRDGLLLDEQMKKIGCLSGPDNPKVVLIEGDGSVSNQYRLSSNSSTFALGNINCAVNASAPAAHYVGTASNGVYKLRWDNLDVLEHLGGPSGLDDITTPSHSDGNHLAGIKNNELHTGYTAWAVTTAANNFNDIKARGYTKPSGGFSTKEWTYIAVGDNGQLYRNNSETGRHDWTSIDSSFGTTNINNVFNVKNTQYWMISGDNGKIAFSPDDGLTWTQETGALGTADNIVGCTYGYPSQIALLVGVDPNIQERTISYSLDNQIVGNLISSNDTIDIARSSSQIDLSFDSSTSSFIGPGFMLYQTADENNVTGDGTLHYLFQDSSNYTKILDNYNAFSNGKYTVTEDMAGRYLMYVSVHLQDLDYTPPEPPPEPTPPCGDPLIIETTNRTYSLINPALRRVDRMTFYFQAIVVLDAGDTCKFAFGTYLEDVERNMDIVRGTFCFGYKL